MFKYYLDTRNPPFPCVQINTGNRTFLVELLRELNELMYLEGLGQNLAHSGTKWSSIKVPDGLERCQ